MIQMRTAHQFGVRLNNLWVDRAKRGVNPEHVRGRVDAFLLERFGIEPEALRADFARHKRWLQTRAAEARLPLEDLTSPLDVETLYLVARAARVRMAIDTGVFYGALTGTLFAAIRDNGGGQLVSIDLPKPSLHGWLVPQDASVQWVLRVGDAREVLPSLIAHSPPIDLFLHDSLHSIAHMAFECEHATQALKRGGILAAHDALAALPWFNGFQRFCLGRRIPYDIFRNLGVAVMQGS